MSYFHIIFDIAHLIVYSYVTLTVLFLFVFAVASLFPYKTDAPKENTFRKIAVLIPAYKEDEVIISVAAEALNQDYPVDKFDIIVIADAFAADTLVKLRKLDIKLFAKNFEISTKSRALNYALGKMEEDYEVACILDADNIMEPDFLKRINQAYNKGFKAIQGHRVAKNMNTSFSILDAVSEEINNNIFRKGQCVLGFSSTLIGSAMAFDYPMFKQMMSEVEVVGGFDKEIEMRLYREGYEIEYLSEAYVYDEKVQNARVFTQQRRRWLSAQFHYFGKHIIPATKALFSEGNYEYFFKAVHYLQLPRVLLLGFLILATALSFFISPDWFGAWLISLSSLVLVFLFSIPRKFYNFRTLKAILSLPKGFVLMALSLLKIRGANEKFIHTKHTYNAFQIKPRFNKSRKK